MIHNRFEALSVCSVIRSKISPDSDVQSIKRTYALMGIFIGLYIRLRGMLYNYSQLLGIYV